MVRLVATGRSGSPTGREGGDERSDGRPARSTSVASRGRGPATGRASDRRPVGGAAAMGMVPAAGRRGLPASTPGSDLAAEEAGPIRTAAVIAKATQDRARAPTTAATIRPPWMEAALSFCLADMAMTSRDGIGSRRAGMEDGSAGFGTARPGSSAGGGDRSARGVGLAPGTAARIGPATSRDWLTAAGVTPRRRATSPVPSPSASSSAARRFRAGRPSSQAAKSTRKAASSAGP